MQKQIGVLFLLIQGEVCDGKRQFCDIIKHRKGDVELDRFCCEGMPRSKLPMDEDVFGNIMMTDEIWSNLKSCMALRPENILKI